MNSKYLVFIFSLLVSSNGFAGAYIFAGEANGVDIVTHPSTYTGAEGVVTVRICIDPSSLNATDMEYSVQNNIAVFNQLTPTLGNVQLGSNNIVPSNAIDFESVALHEIGHCLGMAHANLGNLEGLTNAQQDYTNSTDGTGVDGFIFGAGPDGVIGSSDDVRGDNVNLHWFRRSNNNPFTIDTKVDSITYSRDLMNLPAGHNFSANADRDVASLMGLPVSEAVMQQGTFFGETQRALGHDDVATLRYAASGVNELENDPNNPNQKDNYSIVLEYGGISSTNCDVSMSMTNTTGFASCTVGGAYVDAPNHLRVTDATIVFGDGFNWFFNASNFAPVLNTIGNLNLTEAGTLQVKLSSTDVNAGDTLSFSVSGLPVFASLVDNNDGTATLTITPTIGDASSNVVTVTVTDNGVPVLMDNETFTIDVAVLDSDGDGISDYDELNVYFTDPNDADTDGDNLNDFDEINIHGTSPINQDTDGDLLDDGVEIMYFGDPNDPLSIPNIADGDVAPLGAPDGVISAADYLIAQRIALGELVATSLELAHGDVYPVNNPDGKIDASDLILLLQLIQ